MSGRSGRDYDHRSERPERQNEYWLPGEGISREVIQADICRYLGNDALVRPAQLQGQRGYIIRAYRNLTSEMLADLKADSQRWEADVSRREQQGYPRASYEQSSIHEMRQLAPTGPGYTPVTSQQSYNSYGAPQMPDGRFTNAPIYSTGSPGPYDYAPPHVTYAPHSGPSYQTSGPYGGAISQAQQPSPDPQYTLAANPYENQSRGGANPRFTGDYEIPYGSSSHSMSHPAISAPERVQDSRGSRPPPRETHRGHGGRR